MSIISTTSQGIFYTALNYLKRKFNTKNGKISEASPFYMLISALSSVAGQLFHYLHRAEAEKNIDTAEYKHSIFGLARLAGYEPFRGKSASAVIRLSSANHIVIKPGTRVKIGGYMFFVDGKDNVLYVSKNSNPVDIAVVQGIQRTYSFTSDGTKLQSFTPVCNMTDNERVEVRVNGELYNRKVSLYDMLPDSHDYILRTSISHGLTVVFGDGHRGRQLLKGETVSISVVETEGDAGNGNAASTIEWEDSAYDIDGYAIDINENASFVLVVPPAGGADFEDIEKVRYSATRCSSQHVLATKDHFRSYLSLFPQYRIYDIVSPDDMNSDSGTVFIKAAMNMAKICEDDHMKVFTLHDEDYLIKSYMGTNELERILEDSGKLLLGTNTRVIEPIIRHYIINIGVRIKPGYNKMQIKTDVQKAVADFIVNNNRTDIIPCSDIVVAADAVEGVDTVTVSLVSEYNETAHIRRYYYKEWVEWDDNDTKFETKRIKCMLKEDEELGINNGDIVIGPSELWVLQGGFKDRFNQYYANGLSDGLGCINVLFI